MGEGAEETEKELGSGQLYRPRTRKENSGQEGLKNSDVGWGQDHLGIQIEKETKFWLKS